jgi:L-asparaginase
VIRVTDGLSLPQAMEKSMQEAKNHNGDLAAISLDHSGAIAWGKTCPILLGAYHTGEKIGDTLEWGEEELMGYIA